MKGAALQIVDSHTGGEPTRTIVAGGPDLGRGSMAERKAIFAENFDHIRRALVNEPRGSDVMVGALLCEPVDPAHAAGVIFFNNVGFLNMCGHGTIGVAVTLFHLGQIGLGEHQFETPVGLVTVNLESPNRVSIQNVASYRFIKDQQVEVDRIGKVTGDIAWGGNWFYLIKSHGQKLHTDHSDQLIDYCSRVRQALEVNQITGANGEEIDHIELFGPPTDAALADSQNFVLCPGREYDRSPCGTGTSAKLACLYEDGKLEAGEIWRQQSIIGSVFEGKVAIQAHDIIPQITGEAYVNLEATVVIDAHDPFRHGI